MCQHIRLNGHRGDILHRRMEKPVAVHFNSTNHSLDDLSVTVIEAMRSHDEHLRKRRESYWIRQLQSLHPGGMNLDTVLSDADIHHADCRLLCRRPRLTSDSLPASLSLCIVYKLPVHAMHCTPVEDRVGNMFQFITRVRKMETYNSQKKTLSHTAQYNKKCIPFQPDPCSTFLGALVMPCGGLTDCSLRFTCLLCFRCTYMCI